jgi:hypothetical protein
MAGATGTYDDDIDATHLFRLVEGDVAVWKVTTLHGATERVRGWWPVGPERIAPDLFALLAVVVLDAPTSLAVTNGGISPGEADLAEVERLAAITRESEGLAVAVATLPGSSLDPARLGPPGRRAPLLTARFVDVRDVPASDAQGARGDHGEG